MKNLNKLTITIVAILVSITSVFAQSPEKLSYQAIVRDASNTLISNTEVGIQISLIQTTSDGSVVYLETHTVSSNENGLVSLEIGTGDTSDDFSTIDWSNDIYFVKTEIDTEGGSTYTISSVSQLLSVPYALHAKTAESVENIEITGLEYAFDNWDKDASDDFSGDYNDLLNQPSIPENLSEFTNDEGFITDFTEEDGDATNELEMPQGAIDGEMVYYDGSDWVSIEAPVVEEFASYSMEWDLDNNKPYWKTNYPELKSVDINGTMYIAPENNSDGIVWGANGTFITATSSSDGQANTLEVVTELGEGDYAAYTCDNLETFGFLDWYLPSIDELDAMYQNKAEIGGMDSGLFWSSTEAGASIAKEINFSNGSQINDGKTMTRKVRCVRRD